MKYAEAASRWGAARLRREGIVFEEVTRVDFDVSVVGGCPTCGPETKYEGTVFYLQGGKRRLHEFSFTGLDQILAELFELSEED